ncbi:SprT family protein [Bacillus sp. DTU_2020_1000418_1_SI_GHA_SEK_038]|uniref:SprT family protein n=1 Tax=Bacillus sp. DTU_2020_1000418_1_SI_GHA_SEK_038 TaxID=3077585 RepID=UPI0028E6D359|nr:SprT family protein [Bacillus sp. DTU_2020_1000418_1_SI_GHA_SEK_038]WNS75944.1 SprT family protein [Bacillus sp. DTU_2020_1000418_1_SI_GHA_SEK_038]
MDDLELQKLVEEISLNSFGKVFRHMAYFNGRLRSTGGRYMLDTHNIEINRKYLEQLGFEELSGIIKHELCHYHLHIEGKGYRHRDQDFRLLMKAVGAPRFCSPLPERAKKATLKRVIIYSCIKCGQLYERKRSINTQKYVCGKCKGSLRKIKEIKQG